MLRNRQFLALLAGLIFMLALVFFPSLPFTQDQTVAVVALLAAYMVGEGLEGKRIIENFMQLVKSRKFLATAAGLVVVIIQAFKPDFIVSPDQLTDLLVLVVGLVFSSGVEAKMSASG